MFFGTNYRDQVQQNLYATRVMIKWVTGGEL
jgi:hypothetical protein